MTVSDENKDQATLHIHDNAYDDGPQDNSPRQYKYDKEVEGLIVAEKSISVSNIINGTTRLQPMVMQIGQAAGALAALAVKEGKNIR